MIHWLKTIILPIALISLVAAFQVKQPLDLPASSASPIMEPPSRHLESSLQAVPPAEASTPSPAYTIYDLGVPIGNAIYPRYLALNSQAGQLYIFSEGLAQLEQGNGLTVYDLKAGDFVEQIAVNQGEHEPLDLQFDSAAGLLYALWRPRYTGEETTLTVIDSRSLQPIQALPGVGAMAAGNGRLYIAAGEQITAFEVSNNTLVERQRMTLPPATPGPLAVSPAANRLYFARAGNGGWQLEIFEAETLTWLGGYPIEGPVLNILPLPAGNEVFVVTAPADVRLLHRLTAGGELADLPYELGPGFGAAGIALSPDGQALYFSNGQIRSAVSTSPGSGGPALMGLTSEELAPLHTVPLLANMEDVVIDPETDQLFGLYPFDHHLYAVDLKRETVEIINTAVILRDVLVDEENNHIFVSDTANRIRQFDRQSLKLLQETQLTGNLNDYGFTSASWAGELAIDRGRNRLYVSGLPATVLEADTLAEISTLEPGGQLAPDPTNDKIYMSNCGISILKADTLDADTIIPGSGQRPDGLAPNPCVAYSRLDPVHQLLYSIVPNGIPGSNSGSYLYVYDLAAGPTLIFSDTNISLVSAEPDPAGRRAFVTYIRSSNRRLLTLDTAASPIRYVDQLIGVWGDTRYNPTTNRLYLNDRDYRRLLTLDAGTLDVLAETFLSPDDYYELKTLDTTTEQLYLIGSRGQLLVVPGSPGQVEGQTVVSSPPQTPNGAILTIASRGNETLARIEAEYDEYTLEPRLYSSPNQGQSWTDLSQNLSAMPIQALAASPAYQADQTLLAGLLKFNETGGLYRSTDGGQTWAAAMAGLQDLWVEALFISPDFSQTGLIFARTTYGGLHQSNDGGQSWTPLVSPDPNTLFPTSNQPGTVVFSPQGVVASQSLEGAGGIFQAAAGPDGTLSEWRQIFDVPVTQLGVSPDGQVILGLGSNGLWRSADGGATWEARGAGLTGIDMLQPYQLLFSPAYAQDKTIYFFFNDLAGDLPGRLFRSTDAGQNWQPWVEPIGDKIFTSITLTAEGDFLLGDSNTQLTRLSPAGLSWNDPEMPTTPFPIDDVAVSPDYQADQTLFALSGRYGLYKSGDGGKSWSLTGFPVRAYGFSLKKPHLAISPAYAQDKTLYIATGRSLHRSRDGGESWAQLQLMAQGQSLSFQAQQIALSPHFGRDQTLLASTPAAVYRSTDGGESWQEVLSPADEAYITDLLTFGPDGQRAYTRFGYSFGLFISDDGGQSWRQAPSTRDELFSIISAAVASDGGLAAALEYEKGLLHLQPQAQPWQDISQALPEALANISAVVYGPDGSLFIGGQGGVFKSLDNGQSWQALPTTNLPPDTAITGLDIADSQLFVTTATGEIFTSPDGGVSWVDISIMK